MKKITLSLLLILLLAVPACAKLTQQQAVQVWQQVGEPTGLANLPFNFKDSITPNAWVTAGNSVTVTSGLLNLLDTEDELYGVLAHEAGHVKLNHINKTIRRKVGASILATVIGSVFGGISGPVADVGASLATAGYSREQEIESDDYAVNLAFENGKDLTGLYSALLKMSNYKKTEASGFNSHPPDERRLLHVKHTIISLDPSARIPGEVPEVTEYKPSNELKLTQKLEEQIRQQQGIKNSSAEQAQPKAETKPAEKELTLDEQIKILEQELKQKDAQ